MTHTIETELKPCPFCGGPADLRGQQAPEFWVGCSAIGCKATTEGFGDKARAITAWNTRHRTEALSSAAGEPVAWMYEPIKPLPNHDRYFVQQNRANMDPRFWTETPLYTAPSSQRALVEALEAGTFLLERLDDHEDAMTSEDDAREWHGHVTPAMARFRAALSLTKAQERPA